MESDGKNLSGSNKSFLLRKVLPVLIDGLETMTLTTRSADQLRFLGSGEIGSEVKRSATDAGEVRLVAMGRTCDYAGPEAVGG